VVWEVPTEGAVRGAIAIDGDTAYASSDDGSIYAIDESGTVVWSTELSGPVLERGNYDNYGSKPVVSGGVVYAATQAGMVGAIDAATGAVHWSVDVGAPVETGLALGDGRLHVSTMGNRHVALSTVDGAELWEIDTLRPTTTTPLIMGDKVIVGSRSAVLQVLNEATGEPVWTVTMGGSWVQSGAGAIDESRFAIGSSDYNAVRAFDINTGEGAWLTEVAGWTWGVPVVADGVVYASEIRLDYHLPWDTGLWALDADTGEVLWTASAGEPLEWTADDYPGYGNGAGPVVVGPFVIVPGLDGIVRAYER
jgi:outer membrane protein assembly factor BamB